MKRAFGAVLGMLAGIVMTSAVAQAEWPERPVKLIVPYPGGGAADLPARMLSEALSRKLGQPFVVENRAGAAAAVGTEAVARSTPDGYTFLVGPNSPLSLLPLVRQVPYKPGDFMVVGAYGETIYGLAVLPSTGFKTLKDLVAAAKSKPGKMSYASPGSGSLTNLRMEAFKSVAGIDVIHVPYRTGAESVIDFLAGTIDMTLDNIFFPQLRQGKVVMLGVLTKARHPEFPDVPTFAEQGFDIPLKLWGGVWGPAGTPQIAVDKMNKVLNELAADSDYKEKMLKIGYAVYPATIAEVKKEMEEEVKTMEVWVKRTNFKID